MEILSVGKEPRAVVRASFKHSLLVPKAAFVGGEIAAMWGMGGDILSDAGEPWLLTAPPIERVKVAFLRVARTEVAAMLARRRRLENFVAADYRGAVRLLEGLGFAVDPPQPVGPKRALFRRFWIERPL
jgi:hypothetical protein